MSNLRAKLRRHGDLAFSLFVICGVGLGLWHTRSRSSLLFLPVVLFSFSEFLAWLYSIWTDVMDFFSQLYGNAVRILRTWWGRAGLVLDSWWGQMVHLMYTLYGNLKWLVEDTWTKVYNFFLNLYIRVAALIEMSWTKVFEVCINWYDKISFTFTTAWNNLQDILANLYTSLTRMCRDWWTRIWEYCVTLYGALYNIGYWWYTKIWHVVSDWWSKVEDFFVNLYIRAVTILRDRWEWLMGLVGGVIQDVIGLVTERWPALAWFFTEGWAIWGLILTNPFNLVQFFFEMVATYRAQLRFYLYNFAEHLLRYFWEGVW